MHSGVSGNFIFTFYFFGKGYYKVHIDSGRLQNFVGENVPTKKKKILNYGSGDDDDVSVMPAVFSVKLIGTKKNFRAIKNIRFVRKFDTGSSSTLFARPDTPAL